MAPRNQVTSKSTGLTLEIRTDVERPQAVLAEIRKDAGRKLREALVRAASEVVIPDAKRRAGVLRVTGQSTGASIVARKGRANSVYLTSSMRGKKSRAAGLQEFGGTVRTPIRPRKNRRARGGHAPAVGSGGIYRAVMDTPRTHKPHLFMTRAAHSKAVRGLPEATLRHFMAIFDPLAR